MLVGSTTIIMESEQERRERIKAERKVRRASREETKRKKRERRQQQLEANGRASAADLLRRPPSRTRRRSRQQQQQRECSPPACEDTQKSSSQCCISAAHPTSYENTIRLAIVGCGGWFCNRAHLPALAKIMSRKANTKAKHRGAGQDFDVRITVLCGKADGACKALSTLRRNGINLTNIEDETEKGKTNGTSVADSVVRFDTLEEYLSFEQTAMSSNASAGTSPPLHRSQSLADVCLLCLPIPKMVEAVGMCLRVGKCVISEKPVSPNLRQSLSLWEACIYLQAGNRWMVSENWTHKASLAAMKRLLHLEIIRQQSRPTSYSLSLCQGLDTSGWRGSQLYDGGALRDVGVHVVRALRRLFGEVTSVCECQYHDNESNGIALEGTALHGDYISGKIAIESNENIQQEEQKAMVAVRFGNGIELVWDIAKAKIERHENIDVQLLEQIRGDSWIHGGVKESLEESLDVFAGIVLGRQHSDRVTPKCCPEEALRDVAVIDAMLECGRDCASSSVHVKKFCPPDMLVSSRSTLAFSNTTKTVTYHPSAIARCAGPDDVVAATKSASRMGIAFQPVGSCNSSSVLKSGSMWIDTGLMDRVLEFQIDDSGKAATVCVESGMHLSELCALLTICGFTLPSLPILLDQTIGGALAIGSHGSSTKHGTLSDQIVSMRMVLPSGELVTVVEDGASTADVKSKGGKVVRNSSFLKAARCGVGRVGVVLDVALQLLPTPSICKEEVQLDMSVDRIGDIIRALALSADHCWIHWKIPNRTNEPGLAVAAVLEENESDSASLHAKQAPYSARSWYPDGPLMKSLWEGSRRSKGGERKYTVQWSFPLSSLEVVLQRMSSNLGEQLASRVVELKFLKASEKTYQAPNSVKDESSVEHIVALNAWIDSNDDTIVRLIEQCLVDVPLARPHLGKWHTASLVRDALTDAFDRSIQNCALSMNCLPATNTDESPDPPILLSVILPVYNAMPWAPLAVRDVLKQGLDEGETTEVLCGDDCSTDGSLLFLVEVAILLGDRGTVETYNSASGSSRVLTMHEARALCERRRKMCPRVSKKKSTNPALTQPLRNAELSRRASDLVPDSEAEIIERPLSAEEVAATTHANTRLRVIVPDEDINAGQGEVMTRCLRLCRGRYIGHMESDDERPDGAFRTMMAALRGHPEWDGVTSLIECIGWEAEGMERYVEWQNSLTTPELMQRARFLEIPSMHQAGIFRLEAVLESTGGAQGCFRDDELWPVDTHFWLSFFDHDLVCGKVDKVLFKWRQHPGQQTRSHGRLSIDNLRRCKCHFLCKEDSGWIWKGVKAGGSVRLEVWTSGGSETLRGWTQELKDELNRHEVSSRCTVTGVEWRPGEPVPNSFSDEPPAETQAKRVRLFAFGMEKARRKVREQITDWDENVDIFVS